MAQVAAGIFSSQGSRVGVAFVFGTRRSRLSAGDEVRFVNLLGTESSGMPLLVADVARGLEMVLPDSAVLD